MRNGSGITRRSRPVVWVAAGVVALGGATAAGAVASTHSKSEVKAAAPRVVARSTLAAAPALTGTQRAKSAGANWIDFGGNSLGDRYSALSAINRNNVKTLKVAWQTTLGEPLTLDNVAGGLEYAGTYYIPVGSGGRVRSECHHREDLLEVRERRLRWRPRDRDGERPDLCGAEGQQSPGGDQRCDRQAGVADGAAIPDGDRNHPSWPD